MYQLKVKLRQSSDKETTIIKYFMSDVARNAYLQGLRQAANFAEFDVIDLDDEERRKKWCSVQD